MASDSRSSLDPALLEGLADHLANKFASFVDAAIATIGEFKQRRRRHSFCNTNSADALEYRGRTGGRVQSSEKSAVISPVQAHRSHWLFKSARALSYFSLLWLTSFAACAESLAIASTKVRPPKLPRFTAGAITRTWLLLAMLAFQSGSTAFAATTYSWTGAPSALWSNPITK